MAHAIDGSTGNAAVFVTGKPAWHKLGKVIEQAASSEEAIKLAVLDWDVQQWPIRAFEPDSAEQAGCPGRVANVRTDTKKVLGIVSTSYTVFQNREAFSFMDALVGERLAMYETAGTLDDGKRVWMLARVPREYRLGDGADVVHPYVLLTNSHDGSQALRMIPTTVRVVCQNTLNLALSQASSSDGLTIYHYSSLNDRVPDARAKFGIITARFDKLDEELHALIDREMSGEEVTGYFDDVLPDSPEGGVRMKKHRDEVLGQWRENFESPRQRIPGIRGTAWAAYNAVSEWADHQKRPTGSSERERANNQLKSIWFGAANRTKQRAYASALELARA